MDWWGDRSLLNTGYWGWKLESEEGTTVSWGAGQCVLADESQPHNNSALTGSGAREIYGPQGTSESKAAQRKAIHRAMLTVK
jgi:hypothetical protein